ncbi:MAG: glycosyltransferase [Clostridia bacterium]|nr:glycosyltransferase [Clostridia bacterium]
MEEKVKVLLCTGEMNAGGAEALIMEMLRQHSGAVEYTVLVHYAGEKKKGVFDDEIAALGVRMIHIPSVGSVGQKQYTALLKDINEQYGPFDVIHSHLNGIGGAIAKAAKKISIPARIVHCHADITFKGSFISRLKNEAVLQLMRAYIDKYATHFWACSEPAAKRLFYKKRLKTAVIIPNIIDAEKYLKQPGYAEAAKQRFSLEQEKVLGAVGRIAPIKNYEFIIRLLKILKDRGEKFTFVCFGRVLEKEYFDSLLALAEQEGVEKQVQFLGNSENVADDIHCFDIFLMPSHSEGFGIAAIEAQAAGIPVIASEGVPRIVDVGAGLIDFLDTQEPRQWAERIEALTKQPKQVGNETIIACFNEKGLNSKTAIQKIEQQYLAMREK